MTRHRPAALRTVLTTALLLALPVLAAHAQPADVQLAERRWEERSYGLSLRPPAHARVLEQTTDGALVNFLAENCTIKATVRHNPEMVIDLDELRDKAMARFAFAFPSATVLGDERLTVGERPAFKLYYRVEDEEVGPWVFGQVFVLIEPQTVAVLEFESDAADFERSRAVFEAVLGSVRFADPREIDRTRSRWLALGDAWRDGLTAEQIERAMVPDQWLRVTQDGQDVGYMRITRQREDVMGEPGVRVRVQSRIFDGPAAFDSLSEFFESDDAQTEVWSIRTTRRSAAEQRGLPARGERLRQSEGSWAETGLRSGGKITVSRETPIDIDESTWQVPPKGYISQADLHLLWPLLPRDREQTLAFYAYHPNTSKLALRTLRVAPRPDGGYRVHERPAPDRAEVVSTYDAQGRLVERRMADGRVLVPTNAAQIQAIWGQR